MRFFSNTKSDQHNAPPLLSSTFLVRCPYCNDAQFQAGKHLGTAYTPKRPEDLEKDEELEVLPYARDVQVFDNGEWSRIGGDFYSRLNWDRFLGILQIPSKAKIWYCVGRCPNCTKLVDVFLNQTKVDYPFRKIWPNLLKKGPNGVVKPYKDYDLFTRITSNKLYLFLFLMAAYWAPIALHFSFGQSRTNFVAFFIENFPGFLLRGIIVVTLFGLYLLRNKYMRVFQRKENFEAIFKLREKEKLNYWLNYALLRFTGFQKEKRCFMLNAVGLLGGGSSVIVLLVAWVVANYGILLRRPSVESWAVYTELLFWLVAAYCIGVAVWNFAIVPHYILKQIESIPLNLDPLAHDFRYTKVLDQVSTYAGVGILVLIMCIFALSALPLLFWWFEEPEWVILWGQLTLVLCCVFVIIRFQGGGHPYISGLPLTMAALLLAVYLAFKVVLVAQMTEIVDVERIRATKQLMDMVVFFALAGYLVWLFLQLLRSSEIKNIRKDAKDRAMNTLSEKYKALKKERELSERFDAIGLQRLSYLGSQNSRDNQITRLQEEMERVDKIPIDNPLFEHLKTVPTLSFIVSLATLMLVLSTFILTFIVKLQH